MSFNNDFIRYVLLLFVLYKGEIWGIEKWNDYLRLYSWLVRWGGRMWISIVLGFYLEFFIVLLCGLIDFRIFLFWIGVCVSGFKVIFFGLVFLFFGDFIVLKG